MQTQGEPSSNGFTRAYYARKVLEMHDEQVIPIANTPIIPDVVEQKICVIGAGMSGLYAALILDSLGFEEYDLLEANPERFGGRVFTRYFDITKKWDYIDYGAMRIPGLEIMDRVIGEQSWSLVNYLNKQCGDMIELVPYCLSHKYNFKYYNSTRRMVKDMHGFDPLNFGKSNNGGVPDKYVKKPYTHYLDKAFKKFKDAMRKNFEEGFEELLKVDHFSTRAYLRGETGLPAEVVEYMETLDQGTGIYDQAFTEAVMDSFDFDAYPGVKWWCVAGGTSKLSEAMVKVIKKPLQQGKKVIKIAQKIGKDADRDDATKVLVYLQDEVKAREYDHVINTVPPGVLRTMDTSGCNFSYDKRTGLRALHVGCSVKIGMQFKNRWWQDGKFGFKGGQSTTDLPVRTIVYPSYGVDDKDATGVLIASYTWAQDATRLGSMTANKERLEELALANIAEVHGVTLDYVKSQYTGESYIQDWQRDEFSQGAFALFGPGQFTTFYKGLISPEMDGRYHTAGEMASAHHAWIVGALNSAWRCVYEILSTSKDTRAQDKIKELEKQWGWVDEVIRPVF